jgi:hypothetical protein
MRIFKIFVATAPALAGCSAYRLPDDATRKSIYDIVEQIRCEARRAVIEHAHNYKAASRPALTELSCRRNKVA